jgi:hypothetical protein
MNSSITFTDKGLFLLAVTQLDLEATPVYNVDFDTMSVNSDDIDEIVDILHDNRIVDFTCQRGDAEVEPFDGFRTDAEADADALASAGFGTDEDYGGSNDGGWDE